MHVCAVTGSLTYCLSGCDACRARKVRCTRDDPEDSRQSCKHCIGLGIPCTYDYQPKKRGPPNLWVQVMDCMAWEIHKFLLVIFAVCKRPPLPLLPPSKKGAGRLPCQSSQLRLPSLQVRWLTLYRHLSLLSATFHSHPPLPPSLAPFRRLGIRLQLTHSIRSPILRHLYPPFPKMAMVSLFHLLLMPTLTARLRLSSMPTL
jgi:hypothetical protein